MSHSEPKERAVSVIVYHQDAEEASVSFTGPVYDDGESMLAA